MNSNCGACSNRTKIVAALKQQPGVTVDALGSCLRMPGSKQVAGGHENKVEAFRRSVFPIFGNIYSKGPFHDK